MYFNERVQERAAAARSRPRGHRSDGHSHLVNLAAGRDLPTRRVLELLASTFKLPPAYFAEYRLAELRRQLDERQVGFDTAYRTYQTLRRRRSARSH